MITDKIQKILFGADYFPEQWTEEIWQEDIKLMKKANVNLVSIAIFSWALLQKDEKTYKFEWLDKIMDLLAENDIYACLATGSAAQPVWLTKKYDDILPVQESGLKLNIGSRQSYCPNSPSYLKFSRLLTKKLALRYKNHKALALWHINNEYAQKMKACFCSTCEIEFRKWCKIKYRTIENLNTAWGTELWGEYYFDWEEINAPKTSSGPRNPGKLMDYKRFISESFLKCYLNEYNVIREITPDIPITTNFEGDFKNFDHSSFKDYLDVVSWNCYPNPNDPYAQRWVASRHSMMRGLKQKPFMLMEQAPSQVDWYPVNVAKRPGIMRLFSYHAIAHGSDSVMFFQWRAQKKGVEKYHSGMVPHYGEESRIYKEIAQLGNELEKIREIIGSDNKAKAAILMDNDSWWAVETPYGSGVRSFENSVFWANFTQPFPSICIGYYAEIEYYFNAFYNLNIACDIVPFNSDLTGYKIVIAPMLHVIKPDYKQKLENYVKNGGIFILTYFSGVLDMDSTVFLGGYPGPLKELMGIKVEEFDPMMPDDKNYIVVKEKNDLKLKEEYSCSLWAEIVHTTTAKTISVFKNDYYADFPCITENLFGEGKAYYISTRPDESFMNDFFKSLCNEARLQLPFSTPDKVEVFSRIQNNKEYYFILNFNDRQIEFDFFKENYCDLLSDNVFNGKIKIDKKDVLVLTKK